MVEQKTTTIKFTENQKEVVKDAQDHFEEQFGTRPTQSEAAVIALEKVMEGDA